MSIYNAKDIKGTLEKAEDLLYPYYLFCNSSSKNEIEKMIKEENLPIQKIITSDLVEQNKYYLVKKSDLTLTNYKGK